MENQVPPHSADDSSINDSSANDSSNESMPESEIEAVETTEFDELEADAEFDEDHDEQERDDSRQEERVSKLLSRAGVASRRAAEELLQQGRVSINGHYVREPGAKADPKRDRIIVDGKPVIFAEREPTVVLLHKPKATVTTRSDPQGRATVYDLLPRTFARFYTVGRLDYDTSGVLLLSDDGDLVHRLTHPSHGVWKTYHARVRGVVKYETMQRLSKGIMLEDGPTAPCRARLVAQGEKNALVEVTLREGRNRQVRRMLESMGHPVSSLRRIAFGNVELEGLEAGAHRVLLPGEIKALRKKAEVKAPKQKVTAPRAAKPKQETPKEETPTREKTSREKPKPRPRRSAVARRIEEKWNS